MRRFNWNPEKNEHLRGERGISFEEILFHIENGDILDVLKHPIRTRYEGQHISVVVVNDYVYLAPFVEDEKNI